MPNRRKAKRPKQHLYLVFDEWESGYTIRKLRLPPGSDSGEGAKQPLPEVFMRISAYRGLAGNITSAFGTKILVLHTSASDMKGIQIFDVKNQSLSSDLAPKYPTCPICFPVGDDRLFVLDHSSFDFCIWEPDRTAPWLWHRLTYPPFWRDEVSSYAVQPDGCILVSTKSDATYIFDTKKHVWKLYGDWALPFTGYGHYAPSLDAFVGLSKDPGTLGYLYSCTMARTGAGYTGNILHPSPDCRSSKETVYSKNPAERHVGATLVHMRWDKFCLVECVDTRADEELLLPWADQELLEAGADQELLELGPCADEGPSEPGPDEVLFELGGHVGDRFMYRLKTFSLRHDANGDLKLEHCQVRCYSVPHETTLGFIL